MHECVRGDGDGHQVWTNIDGASSSVYRLNGTMENNNQSIRCLVINTGGETYSETFVVRIAAAQSPSANPLPGGGGARYTQCMLARLSISLAHIQLELGAYLPMLSRV
jgi:hypothetical protein